MKPSDIETTETESKPLDLKLTMIAIWAELTEEERQGLANFSRIPLGQMGLTKISTLLKAIYYRYYYDPQTQMYPNTAHNAGGVSSIGSAYGSGGGGAAAHIGVVKAAAQQQAVLQQYAAANQAALNAAYHRHRYPAASGLSITGDNISDTITNTSSRWAPFLGKLFGSW